MKKQNSQLKLKKINITRLNTHKMNKILGGDGETTLPTSSAQTERNCEKTKHTC